MVDTRVPTRHDGPLLDRRGEVGHERCVGDPRVVSGGFPRCTTHGRGTRVEHRCVSAPLRPGAPSSERSRGRPEEDRDRRETAPKFRRISLVDNPLSQKGLWDVGEDLVPGSSGVSSVGVETRPVHAEPPLPPPGTGIPPTPTGHKDDRKPNSTPLETMVLYDTGDCEIVSIPVRLGPPLDPVAANPPVRFHSRPTTLPPRTVAHGSREIY